MLSPHIRVVCGILKTYIIFSFVYMYFFPITLIIVYYIKLYDINYLVYNIKYYIILLHAYSIATLVLHCT